MLDWAFRPNTRLSLLDSHLLKTLATSLPQFFLVQLQTLLEVTEIFVKFHCLSSRSKMTCIEMTLYQNDQILFGRVGMFPENYMMQVE